MVREYTLSFEDETIRFTPEGKIAVMDAIRALSGSLAPEDIWALLVKDHPEIESLCRHYTFADNSVECVVDGTGWDKIEELLFAYMVEQRL